MDTVLLRLPALLAACSVDLRVGLCIILGCYSPQDEQASGRERERESNAASSVDTGDEMRLDVMIAPMEEDRP